MKVLLLGATGNVGSRVLAALLVHGHTPVVLVRSPSKLDQKLLKNIPSSSIVTGSATESEIKQAMIEYDCEALINTAGAAGYDAENKEFQELVKTVVNAAVAVSRERGRPVRAWFMAGWTAMDQPGTNGRMIVEDVYMFPDHKPIYAYLQTLPATDLNWSTLNASGMHPAELTNPGASNEDGLALAKETQAQSSKIVAGADTPPNWKSELGLQENAGRYLNTLEQTAEAIVRDLDQGVDSEFSRKRVGLHVVD